MRVRLGRAKTNLNVVSKTLRTVLRRREPGLSVIQAQVARTNRRIARPALRNGAMRRQEVEA
jgi:hypothetical protein